MADNESKVELSSEPKLNGRFGINSDRKVQSAKTIKIGIGASVVVLAIVMLLKTPDKVENKESEIATPEVSRIGQSTIENKFDTYSPVSENKKLIQNRNSSVIRYPGLQKIERKRLSEIPPGSLVKAVLITGASNGLVRAELKESLQIQGETILPEGAILLGVGQSGEERLAIRFTQIVFKDGSFESIQAQAADANDKIAGLNGSRVGSYAAKYAAAIGLNFIGGMAEGLQNREIVGQQVVTKTDVKNAMLSGTSKATLELASDTMSNMKNKSPVIEVPAGKEILVLFEAGH